MKLTFSRYIPADSTEHKDEQSDAVVYLFERAGKPCAIGYHGKANRQDFHYNYRSTERREQHVEEFFATRRARLANRKEQRADRAAFVHDYKVGDIFRTCWGYDQTNVEFFEVTEVKGKHLILREVAQARVETGFMCGRCVPQSGQFKGEPLRRLATRHGVRIDGVRHGSKWNIEDLKGLKLGEACFYSEYA
ncbi:MAG TPA: hypothetical protein VMI56_17165 [Reyranella sp.]|nr:hypothetical protein [Reyranella sp.]